jgi:hypothetical protein
MWISPYQDIWKGINGLENSQNAHAMTASRRRDHARFCGTKQQAAL